MTASAAPVELPLPRKIGRYTLFDRIGRGGMADIFLAHAKTDLGISRLVVVKQILSHLAASREFSELLITEAKLSARLDHANIVQVHDLGSADGFLYIAMQYVEGFDLNELLRLCTRTKTPLPVQYSLLIVIEALRGLDYAHRRTTDDGRPLGIVHRDVSPSNLLISLEGEVKLCDFGIAHAHDAFGVYSDDVIKGKAGYMSPEQARGDAIDARADVFAVGIVLWELLSGYRLYRTGNDQGASLLAKARAAEIPPLPSRGLPLEAELFAILNKALARNREERHPTAQAMLHDLLQYVAESRLVASPLRFREWLVERFGDQLIEQRRARERAAKALETEEVGRGDGNSTARHAVGVAAAESSAELPSGVEASAHRIQEVPAERPRSPAPLVVTRPQRGAGVRFVGFVVILLLAYFVVSHC
jgi:serine/threonine protein kinase